MKIQLASSYGFCFGVKRAIEIAEEHKGSVTYGPLIHNKDEINRLKVGFDIGLAENLNDIQTDDAVVIRTHGIPKNELEVLNTQDHKVIDATCPYVTTPQNIVEKMSDDGYSIVIFGDASHPEIKGVVSYAKYQDDAFIVLEPEELDDLPLRGKVAVVSQTTKKPEDFAKIVAALMLTRKEIRVFNTICNATFENQDAAAELAKDADVMVVIGGKHSSNTKQLHSICQRDCANSYLIENETELDASWFDGKTFCGISAGASTPDWIVQNVIDSIQEMKQ
ncbi:MAG: 4-hydroxy-3-methylbut-2-enyl diphosphate reductase (EC [uncultured Sulfurovum sp.]|uniref:4-hydroxy-3-methylbut-2-enyl diphosphate reductase n=1 Tax=uncultured Sulfurovum sp. TaxID=269237 RepID=A0A6S6T1P0_9BACT|nr:MAG: 4-hydroxy-3-methylbut-2-enyl diphosphate reductase (EC [uncultured Sulfurovum sp.]